jgi:hypothetical protein
VFRLGLACFLILASGATAATFTVTNLADSGPGSLRQAVLNANAAPGADEIAFAPGLTGTITLTFASGEIPITDSLIVDGPGAGVLTVSANVISRIFNVENSAVPTPIDVTLSGLTLTRGRSGGRGPGGAVFADSENLTILDSVISDSSSGLDEDPSSAGCGGNVGFVGTDGGTLRIADSTLTRGTAVNIGSPSFGGNLCVFKGKLILERSTLSDGFAATGGGLYLDSLTEDSTILSSTISDNQGFEAGGGIVARDLAAALTIDSSTISGNTAGFLDPGPNPDRAFGGGLYIIGDNLRIINSTISGNHAVGLGFGGGLFFFGESNSLLLRLTTILNNTASRKGGSILVGGVPPATVQLDHSIVANGAPEDLAAYLSDQLSVTANYSLIEAPGSAVLVGANNLVGVDPLLGSLANNGGPTLTHRPLPGSPVIDAGNPAIPNPPATDQRGFARIFGAAVDLGAVEARPELVEVPALSRMGLLALAALLGLGGVWRLSVLRPPWGNDPPRGSA